MIQLTTQHPDGSVVDIEFLRPESWLLEHRWRPGLIVRTPLPETNLATLTHIHSITPAPTPAPGPGRLVTGRYTTRLARNLVEVKLEDGSTVQGTGNHPVWSHSRSNWVALEELEPGELLLGHKGPVAVRCVRPLPGSGRVYNLEIHGQQVYRVGPAGVLVHNNGGECPIPKINGRKPINSRYAGQEHPAGVRFKENGFPDFGPHVKIEVEVPNLTGNYKIDESLANKIAGLKETPKGYVWHHVEDAKTVQLIPKEIHDKVRHTGGAAVIRGEQIP